MTRSRLTRFLRKETKLISQATEEALGFFRSAHASNFRGPAPGSQPHAMAIAEDAAAPKLEWVRFTPDTIEERSVDDVADLRPALETESVDWIQVQGFGDEAQLRELGALFAIHPLALADTVNIPQRAKVDTYDDQQLIVLRMARIVEHEIDIQQLSIIVGPSWMISFVEHPGDVFDPVRLRVRTAGTPIRRSGVDYLAYALIDAVVDGFFPVVDLLGDHLDELEEAAIGDPAPRTLARIHAFRRLLIHLCKSQRQQRDAVIQLSRQDHGSFGEELRPYLRDLEDHAIHVLDTFETLREMSVGVMDIYLSSVSNRTNDVMKTLTVMASLFIPLTFIVGVYGMNFKHMPELEWRWGYAAVWGLMVFVAAALVGWFGWRGWLGAFRRRPKEGGDGDKKDEG